MNGIERKNLRKDKDLVRELYSIIKKYLPDLFIMFDNLTNVRHQSYVTYKMKTICVTRLDFFVVLLLYQTFFSILLIQIIVLKIICYLWQRFKRTSLLGSYSRCFY